MISHPTPRCPLSVSVPLLPTDPLGLHEEAGASNYLEQSIHPRQQLQQQQSPTSATTAQLLRSTPLHPTALHFTQQSLLFPYSSPFSFLVIKLFYLSATVPVSLPFPSTCVVVTVANFVDNVGIVRSFVRSFVCLFVFCGSYNGNIHPPLRSSPRSCHVYFHVCR